MDISTMWHCALVSCTPPQSIGLVFGCAPFWCWVSLCVTFTSPLIGCYFIMMVTTVMYVFLYSYGILLPLYAFWTTILCFLKLCSLGSATTHLPGYFCPWTFSLNIGLNMLPPDSCMSCLDYLLRYSTRNFKFCNWFHTTETKSARGPFY